MADKSEGKPPVARVVIFDDEAGMAQILAKTLRREGYEAREFTNPVEGMDALAQFQPDVILTDIQMGKVSGIDVLNRVRREFHDVPVLAITAYGTVEGAVEAMRAGAFNYITKPIEPGNLIAQVTRAVEHRRILQENVRLDEQFSGSHQREIVGDSEPVRQLRTIIARAAPTDSSILITGRSGVGKELVARAIHAQGPRCEKRFVAINCPSIPPPLIESEMFGHERGAFTGADRSKMGLVELAQGGTLFLDEVAELPAEMQVKLLRVLQEREIQRVGGLRQIAVDIRVIAATNRDLPEEMKAGRFREDLFYRLNVIQIPIPTLSERIDDIPLLADHVLRRFGRRMMRPDLKLTANALNELKNYGWPGNVRELENVLERAVVLAAGDTIDASDLALDPRARTAAIDAPAAAAPAAGFDVEYRKARDNFERQYLLFLIDRAGGNMTHAADLAGISRRNLYEKLERVGLAEEVVRKR